MLRAWRNQHRIETGRRDSLRPWLVTVARRIAIDEHRAATSINRPQETYGRDMEHFEVSDGTKELDERLRVRAAMAQLSQPHRQILFEVYFQGKSVPEAAEVLGIPLGTAKSRIYYAYRGMRSILEEGEHSPEETPRERAERA